MRLPLALLCALCALCAAAVHGIFHGTCPRKEPPPGVLVLSPGNKLVLTCGGHVTVDGVKVNVAEKNSLNDDNRSGTSSSHRKTVSGHTPTPTPTSAETNWEDEEEEEEEGEEGEEGTRVTRGVKSRPQWKWNGRKVGDGDGDRDWGDASVGGGTLCLSSVRVKDSGRFTCHHRGRERFSLKVTVAVPPVTPTLTCYKRSPSSKLRCEGSLQTLSPQPDCHLFLGKGNTQSFQRLRCEFSSRRSRCWCALTPDDDELRVSHMAFLCVSNVAGNATSGLLTFSPMTILKPDPPSKITAQPVEGVERWIRVSWSFPTSWNSQGNHYQLIYEVKYQPDLVPSEEQLVPVGSDRSYTIRDALTGDQYLIRVRAKDDHDGSWSEWSPPVRAASWKNPVTVSSDSSTELLIPFYTEGSGSGDNESDGPDPEESTALTASHPIWWISVSFAVFSAILAAYIFRHKDRFMPKLQTLTVVSRRGDSPHPPLHPHPPHPHPPAASAPKAPEEQALVTFGPPRYRDRQRSEEEDGDEDEEDVVDGERRDERTEAVHFTNTSYFFLQR